MNKPDQPARLTGVYPDGGTFVSWFKSANSPSGRRWEIVSVDKDQAEADLVEAHRYTFLPTLMYTLEEIELLLDAALHPTLEISDGDSLEMIEYVHSQLRILLGMPALSPQPTEQTQSEPAPVVYPTRSE